MNNWRERLQNPVHADTVKFLEHVKEVGVTTRGELRAWFDANYPEDGSTPLQLDNTFEMFYWALDELHVGTLEGDYLNVPETRVTWNKGC